MKSYIHGLGTSILVTAITLSHVPFFITGMFITLIVIGVDYARKQSNLRLLKDFFGNTFAAFLTSALFANNELAFAFSCVSAFYTFLELLLRDLE